MPAQHDSVTSLEVRRSGSTPATVLANQRVSLVGDRVQPRML